MQTHVHTERDHHDELLTGGTVRMLTPDDMPAYLRDEFVSLLKCKPFDVRDYGVVVSYCAWLHKLKDKTQDIDMNDLKTITSQLKQLGRELGLTPRSRIELNIERAKTQRLQDTCAQQDGILD